MNKRRMITKDILWVLASVGLVAAVMRFARGLGPSTALTDATPWGLWIAFDVLGGVALAAGGFVVAATVYIFHLEKYKPILRPAILTAFLGYGAVIVGLICDLGLPWHIWKPTVHWQHHSVLFEVAWCVMLYFTVLALEFSPVILEHPWFAHPVWQRIAKVIKTLSLPLVIAGIILSTLHQSSLGSLFLIMPFRLHPLWYSPLIPVLFFVSAVGLGLMMVTLEGFVSAYLYRHKLKMDVLAGLGRAAAVVLWVYLALRLGDLAIRGVLPGALDGSWQSVLFLVEILICAVVPAILLSIPSVRAHPLGLGTCAVVTVTGMVLNRLSVGMMAMERPPGMTYVPSWIELAISLGIVAGAGLVFLLFTEHLAVFGEEEGHAEESPDPYARPAFDPSTQVYIDPSLRGAVARRSLIFVVVVALTAGVLPPRLVTGQQPPDTPVQPALGWDVLLIDGNQAQESVRFDHADHQARLEKELAGPSEVNKELILTACRCCHHLSKPHDGPTSCWECHRDMYRQTSIFDHDLHKEKLGGNAGCGQCHQDETGQPGTHSQETAIACADCHENMVPGKGEAKFNYKEVPSYKDAMHGQCIGCHREESKKLNRPRLALCPTCHQEFEEESGSGQ